MFKSSAETILKMEKSELEIAEKDVKVEEVEEVRGELCGEVKGVERECGREMFPLVATLP